MKGQNLILRLPRELRDEIYGHLLITPHRLRLTTSTEADKIRSAGPAGRQSWSSRDGTGPVLSIIFDTAILASNRQIFAEARQILLAKNTFLLVPPTHDQIAFPPWNSCEGNFMASNCMHSGHTRSVLLQRAIELELVPFSWPQLQDCIALLKLNKDIKKLTINFKRMMYDVDPDDWPILEDVKCMLLELSSIKVKEKAIIIWYANFGYLYDGPKFWDRNMTEIEIRQELTAVAENMMIGGGTAEQREMLSHHLASHPGESNWQRHCKKYKTLKGVF